MYVEATLCCSSLRSVIDYFTTVDRNARVFGVLFVQDGVDAGVYLRGSGVVGQGKGRGGGQKIPDYLALDLEDRHDFGVHLLLQMLAANREDF